MKKRPWTRLLAFFLSIAMVMTCLPLTVLAVDGGGGGGSQTGRTPAQAAAEGYDVHYFVKVTGNGWTFQDDADLVYVRDNSGTNFTGTFSDGVYQIYSSNGNKYLSAPYKTSEGVNSTAQGGSTDTTKFRFVPVENSNGGYYIQSNSDTSLYMTGDEADFNLGTNKWKGILFDTVGETFYITPAGNDAYWIWYQTGGPTVSEPEAYTPADAVNAGYDVHYFAKYGSTGWTIQDTAATVIIKNNGNKVTGKFSADEQYQIDDSANAHLYAPFTNAGAGVTNVTAQGSVGNFNFVPVEDSNGGYQIKIADSDLYLTQTVVDFTFQSNPWKGLQCGAEGAAFYITPANKPNDGTYYIWYQTKADPDPEPSVDPDPTETIEHHAPTAGMVQHYLHYVSPGWGGPTTKAALELHNVANGVYTKDTDGVINSGTYGIYDANPGDGGSKRWLHAGDGVTNQCGGQHDSGAAHEFTFTYNAEKRAYTIKSVSTGAYLTQTASGSQLAMNSTPTYFYIDPVEGSAGSYYIWWETEVNLGDAISEMFDTSRDNTWVFTGGADVEGGYAQTQSHRNFMGHFEEYIRWQLAGGGTNENNATGFNEPRQRYTINTAHTGLTLSGIVNDWNGYVGDYKPRAVVYMVGNEDAASGSFAADLGSFIDKSLALRNNNGFAVIIKSYSSSLSGLNSSVDTVVEGYKSDAGKYSHIVVVTPTGITEMNAAGHYALGQKLVEATYGSSSNYPSTPYSNSTPATYAEKPAPSTYDTATVPTVAWTDAGMVITLGGSFTYEVRLSSGVTVSGSGTGSATVTDLPANESYTLVTRSQDGATQYKTLTGKVGGGAADVEQNATQAAIANLMTSEEPLTWLFMGDSITHGAMWTSGYDSISQTFDKYLDMLGRPEDVVINTAVSSADTRSTNNAIAYRLGQYPAPDVVAIMLGTNDQTSLKNTGTYTENLGKIVDAIKEKNPNAVIILRAPTGNYASTTDRKAYRDAMEAFATANSLLFIDQWTEFVEFATAYSAWTTPPGNGSTDNSKRLYFGNELHPGALGQLTMSRMFIKAIGLWDEDTPIANLDYEWPNMTTQTGTLAKNALIADEDSISITVPSGMGQTTLTATNKAGQSWSVTAKAGETPELTGLPEGKYTVTVSSVSKTAAQTVNYAAVEMTLPYVPGEDDGKFDAPEEPEISVSYEYLRTSGELTEGIYAIVATTDEGSNTQVRVMHPWYNDKGVLKVDQCKAAAPDAPTININANKLCGSDPVGTHLFTVAKSGDGYTFQVAAGNAAGKYLTASASGVSLGDTATVFTVTPVEGGGYYLSVDGSYISWNGSWKASTTSYRLNLYKETEVSHIAQTKFSGTSQGQPMVKADTHSKFRIPALTTLSNGWIMASSDIRWTTTADSPANLDTIVSISKDGGQTWNWEVVNYFSDFASTVNSNASASFIDSAIVQTKDGTIWMLVDIQAPYVNGGNTGTGFDDQGRLKVGYIADPSTCTGKDAVTSFDYYVDINNPNAGAERTVDMTALEGGASETVKLWPICAQGSGLKTGYYADAFFNTYYDYGENDGVKPVIAQQKDGNGQSNGKIIHNNLFYTQSSWRTFSTAYITLYHATINDATGKLEWSAPTLLNGQIKQYNESFIGVCPGRGNAVMLDETTERIIFPVYDNSTGTEKASIIYSDDGGQTWHRGNRAPNGEADKSSESQIVELPDGKGGTFLRMYSRNAGGNGKFISYADSYNNGETWSAEKFDYDLACGHNTMVSFINLEGYLVDPEGNVYENLILASYPMGTKDRAHATRRTNGVVRIGSYSTKTGEVTWHNPVDFDGTGIRYPFKFTYSCVTQLLDENGKPADGFAILYEDETNGLEIVYDAFTTDDLLKGWNWVLTVPEASVDTELVDLDVGEEQQIGLTVSDADAAVTWISSNPAVATVVNGVVTAVSAGKATVTIGITTVAGIKLSVDVQVLVSDDENITVPDKYADEIIEAIVPASTTYPWDKDGVDSGVNYIIHNPIGGAMLYHKSGELKTNQNSDSNAGETLSKTPANTTLWTIEAVEGGYTFKNVNSGRYLQIVEAAETFPVSDTANTIFTITPVEGKPGYYHISAVVDGTTYYVNHTGKGGKFYSVTDSAQATDLRLYKEDVTEASTSYTVTADGLKALIAALGEDESDYADTLALAGSAYTDKDEADQAQAQIDALTKALYAKLRNPEKPHEHDWDDGEVTKQPTCTEEGVRTFTCSGCDETRTEPVDALGHDREQRDGKDATCTETGWNAYETCKRCDYTTYQEINALDHDFSEAFEHNSENHWHKCTRCDVVDGMEAHTYTDEVTAEPTTASEGVLTHTCTCGYSYTESIPMLEEPENPVVPVVPPVPPVEDIGDDNPPQGDLPDEPGEDIDDPETPLGDLPFIDVSVDAWYAQAIANVYAKGYMDGTSVMTFSPKMSLNRGMMAQIIHNMAENPEATVKAPFADVDGRDYTEAVAWGAAHGVLKGLSAANYGGEKDLTREQMAVMLHRYAKTLGLDVDGDADALAQFTDGESVSGWAEDAIRWAVTKGLFQGRTNGSLDPQASVTRAEVAAVLDRFSKLFLA